MDSALYYTQKCYQEILSTKHLDYQSICLKLFGQIYSKMSQYDLALDYLRQSLAIRQQYSFWDFGELNAEMAFIFKTKGQLDSAVYHAEQALVEAQKLNTVVAVKNRLKAATLLFELNETKNPAAALKYHLLAMAAKDSLNNVEHVKQVERLTYEERERLQQIQQVKEKGFIWSGLAFITLIAMGLFYNNRQKQRTNILLQKQKTALDTALKDLKTTQAQLIQIETQQNLERERTRIARDMHDDISSGLSAINLLANYIKNTPLSTDTHLEIQHIAESSTELNQRIREIIWAVSSESDNVEGLVHFLRRYVSEFGEIHHIEVHFDAPENLPDMKLSNETKRNIFLCVKEALTNISKYAQASLVEVSIELKNLEMMLMIKDNGMGFEIETALKNGGNGLKNIKERMKQIGGEVLISVEKGCVIQCKIPLK